MSPRAVGNLLLALGTVCAILAFWPRQEPEERFPGDERFRRNQSC